MLKIKYVLGLLSIIAIIATTIFPINVQALPNPALLVTVQQTFALIDEAIVQQPVPPNAGGIYIDKIQYERYPHVQGRNYWVRHWEYDLNWVLISFDESFPLYYPVMYDNYSWVSGPFQSYDEKSCSSFLEIVNNNSRAVYVTVIVNGTELDSEGSSVGPFHGEALFYVAANTTLSNISIPGNYMNGFVSKTVTWAP